MDGHYNSTLDIRIPSADTIVFFNFNKLLCLYRVIKRILRKNQPFDKAEGNKDKVSLNLIKKIIKFPKDKILEKLEPFKKTKKIFVVNNSKNAEELLIQLTKNRC